MPSLDALHLWDKCESTTGHTMSERSNHHGDELCTKADSNGMQSRVLKP